MVNFPGQNFYEKEKDHKPPDINKIIFHIKFSNYFLYSSSFFFFFEVLLKAFTKFIRHIKSIEAY